MNRILVIAALAASSALVLPAETLNVANGGGFESAKPDGLRFSPSLFDAGWGGCRAVGGWSDAPGGANGGAARTFKLVDKQDATVVDGRVTYARGVDGDAAALRITWDFSVVRDFDAKTFCIGWNLPCRAFAGRTVAFGGKAVALPAAGGKSYLGGASTDAVGFDGPDGARYDVKLAAPTWCMVQDNREWKGDSFTLRMSVGKDRLKAGEKRSLTLTLRGFDTFGGGRCTVAASDVWIPLDDTTDVKEGSALDFSRMGWLGAPAGKYGRVVAKGDHFEFERKPGVAQRFYGVNLCFTANYLSADDAEKLATRLTRFGYNALRIHHYERELCDPKDGTTVRPEKMAQLDNLLNACIRHGIYLTTDLFVSRGIPWRSCGIDRDGKVPMDQFKELVLFHEGAYRNYLAFARQLLDHVNPATGRRWADEPAVAFLALVNEGNPGNHGYGFLRDLPEAKAAWTKWLAAKKAAEGATYAAITDKVPDNCWENTPQNCAYSLFLADVEIAFAKRMRAFVRDEMKSRVLLTDLSCWKNPIHYQLCRAQYDYVDDHFYVDHPHFLEKSWQLPSQCPNANPVRGRNEGFESVVKHRLLDRPFTITEFNYSGPGQYRGVGGMMLGAQAALQEFDGIWRFAWSHSADGVLEPRSMSYFDVARDPLQRATERAVTMLYLRGDMKPLERTHAVVFPEKALRSDFSCGPQADISEMWFGWRSRFGTLVADAMPAGAKTGGLFPEVYSRTAEDYRRWAEGTVPGDGQVVIDRERGLFGVNTPRTAGFFAEEGRAAVGPLTVTIGEKPTAENSAAAAVWVSALDDAPIASSKRLLLTHVTDVQDEGTVYASAAKKVLLKWGRLPHLIRRGTATVEIAFADGAPVRVYALAPDGTRRGEVEVVSQGSRAVFKVDTAVTPGSATCFYEIVR